MEWTGRAFRPPPKDDSDAWYVASQVIARGHRFNSTRERRAMPHTRRELQGWPQPAREDLWTPEVKLTWKVGAHGEVFDVRGGRRALLDHDALLLMIDGAWVPAVIRLRGNGFKVLHRPVLVRTDVAAPALAVTTSPRVRLLRRD
jgi:hypothetical protein